MRDGFGFVSGFHGLVFSVACRVEHTLVFGATCGIGFVGGCGIGHTLPFGSTCGTGFRNGYGRSTLCGIAVNVWHEALLGVLVPIISGFVLVLFSLRLVPFLFG